MSFHMERKLNLLAIIFKMLLQLPRTLSTSESVVLRHIVSKSCRINHGGNTKPLQQHPKGVTILDAESSISTSTESVELSTEPYFHSNCTLCPSAGQQVRPD